MNLSVIVGNHGEAMLCLSYLVGYRHNNAELYKLQTMLVVSGVCPAQVSGISANFFDMLLVKDLFRHPAQ